MVHGSHRQLLKRYGRRKQCPLADTRSDEEEGGDTMVTLCFDFESNGR